MEIDKKLYSEIKEYCKENSLKLGSFLNQIIQVGFNIEKFGEQPPFMDSNKVVTNKVITSVEIAPPPREIEIIKGDISNKEEITDNLGHIGNGIIENTDENKKIIKEIEGKIIKTNKRIIKSN